MLYKFFFFLIKIFAHCRLTIPTKEAETLSNLDFIFLSCFPFVPSLLNTFLKTPLSSCDEHCDLSPVTMYSEKKKKYPLWEPAASKAETSLVVHLHPKSHPRACVLGSLWITSFLHFLLELLRLHVFCFSTSLLLSPTTKKMRQ